MRQLVRTVFAVLTIALTLLGTGTAASSAPPWENVCSYPFNSC